MQNQVKVDEIDANVIKILLEESRTSFTDIAKSCGISVGAVRMRYKNLWKKGIINGEIMLVNPYSLRYRHVMIIGVETTRKNEDKVLKFLKRKPFVGYVFKNFGKYNFGAQIAIKNMGELTVIQRNLEASPLIKRADALIFAGDIVVEHPENLIIKPFSGTKEHKPITTVKKRIIMDEIDKKIVKILSEKSRTPFCRIAKQLDISTKNVIERYRKLRGNVLTLSTITVDITKLGYNASALLFIKLANKSKVAEVVNELLQIPNLLALVKYIGDYDLFAYLVLENFQGYFKTENSIRNIENIDYFDFHLVPNLPAWPPNLYSPFLNENQTG